MTVTFLLFARYGPCSSISEYRYRKVMNGVDWVALRDSGASQVGGLVKFASEFGSVDPATEAQQHSPPLARHGRRRLVSTDNPPC